MELNYETMFDVPQYNGNIAGVKWKNKSDGKERSYGYLYDPLNRFMMADYAQHNTS
jgi:hypothetical protein